MNIVVLPFHDYKVALKEGFRTRDTHLIKHFSKSKLVDKLIVINRPTLFLEVVLRKKKFLTGGKIIYQNNGTVIQMFDDKTYVIDTIDFSFLSPVLQKKAFIPELYEINANKIKLALEYLKVDSFISYESSPLTRKCLNKLKPVRRIFDGVDNFCLHSTYSSLKDYLKLEYKEIIKSYDKVFFNSHASIDFFDCRKFKNVSMLANGVDFERFQGEISRPDIYKINNNLVSVYAGKMQNMFDIDLAKDLAEQNPDVSFFYLGKILEGNAREELSVYHNVTFTGDIHYEQLPAYITNADICIIPYRVDRQHGGDPIKFYEYYATGLPIVTTKIGEISKYGNNSDVFIVDRSEFLSAFKLAIQRRKISRTLPDELRWERKCEIMLESVVYD
ncbi:glycosyltransferase [Shewanella sp. 0m-11]